MPNEFATLNNAGNSVDNPILQGIHFRITLEKHDAAETLKKLWIESPLGVVYRDLTALAVQTATTIWVAVESGDHLRHDRPAALNIIHIATSERKVKRGLYVVTAPGFDIGGGARLSTPESLPHRIELDGYNGDNFEKPHMIHFSNT